MSEDRTKKDPLLGGLDGMRARQTWEGAPEKMNAGGDGQAASETEPVPEDSAQAVLPRTPDRSRKSSLPKKCRLLRKRREGSRRSCTGRR